jgi:hypothetical protein
MNQEIAIPLERDSKYRATLPDERGKVVLFKKAA